MLYPLGAIYIVAKIYSSIDREIKVSRRERRLFLQNFHFYQHWTSFPIACNVPGIYAPEPIKISVNETTITFEMKSNSENKYLLSSLPMVYRWNIISLREKFNKINIDRGKIALLLLNQILIFHLISFFNPLHFLYFM